MQTLLAGSRWPAVLAMCGQLKDANPKLAGSFKSVSAATVSTQNPNAPP